MFFIGIGPQCFFMFTSSSTLSYFFSNRQSTRDSHVCRACISLKKGVYPHLPSNRCNSILYHLLVCPKLASQFQNSRVAQARTCSGKQRSSTRNIRTSKIAKDPARTRLWNCPFCGFTEIIFILANDVTGRFLAPYSMHCISWGFPNLGHPIIQQSGAPRKNTHTECSSSSTHWPNHCYT